MGADNSVGFTVQQKLRERALFLVKDKLDSITKDWEHYYKVQKQIYIDDVNSWYSQFYGEDLTNYIDKDFSYKDVINND